jgi:hypothetical protein
VKLRAAFERLVLHRDSPADCDLLALAVAAQEARQAWLSAVRDGTAKDNAEALWLRWTAANKAIDEREQEGQA